jgi:hypothetical protein
MADREGKPRSSDAGPQNRKEKNEHDEHQEEDYGERMRKRVEERRTTQHQKK